MNTMSNKLKERNSSSSMNTMSNKLKERNSSPSMNTMSNKLKERNSSSCKPNEVVNLQQVIIQSNGHNV